VTMGVIFSVMLGMCIQFVNEAAMIGTWVSSVNAWIPYFERWCRNAHYFESVFTESARNRHRSNLVYGMRSNCRIYTNEYWPYTIISVRLSCVVLFKRDEFIPTRHITRSHTEHPPLHNIE